MNFQPSWHLKPHKSCFCKNGGIFCTLQIVFGFFVHQHHCGSQNCVTVQGGELTVQLWVWNSRAMRHLVALLLLSGNEGHTSPWRWFTSLRFIEIIPLFSQLDSLFLSFLCIHRPSHLEAAYITLKSPLATQSLRGRLFRDCWSRKSRKCFTGLWLFVQHSIISMFHVRMCHSVRLHAQFSQITAIVRLCYSIRQLQLSEYTCWWENQIIGWNMSYPSTIGGAVPISTSGNRNTSSWPLFLTSNNKLCLGIRERWRTKSEMKLHLCTFCIWCSW